MLCINSYPQEYIDSCRTRIESQLASYSALKAKAKLFEPEIADFEADFFNNLVLAMDNFFCHRSRTLEKKDGNPINEVRMLVNSLLLNDGKLSPETSIKFVPQKSVLGLNIGDEIRLSEADFRKLSAAFFAEIEAKFSEAVVSMN